jgi:hypothetical protein
MAELMVLAREAREQGWWTEYSDLKLEPYIGLEESDAAITAFSMYFVPALLQTEAYAREMIRAIAPKMDQKVREQRLEVRMRRQRLLDQDNPPRYRTFLDQAVLARRIGGAEVMAAQLGRILAQAQAAKATVQVIPFDVGAYEATDSSFVFLELREPLSAVVFVEGLTKNQYHEKPTDIARYQESIENIRDLALTPRDSIALITEVQKSYVG